MLEIRPHHILCMRAFQGMGYSEEFTKNMEKVIKEIKLYNKFYNKEDDTNHLDDFEKENSKVRIVFSLDSLCKKCPNNIENNICTSEEKVNELDAKVCYHFNLQEGIYVYKELENLVYKNMTEEIFDDICKGCSWYDMANCKKFIL